MTYVLFFMVLFVVTSVWDVHRINDLLDRTINQRPRKAAPAPAPAPRLVIKPPTQRDDV